MIKMMTIIGQESVLCAICLERSELPIFPIAAKSLNLYGDFWFFSQYGGRRIGVINVIKMLLLRNFCVFLLKIYPTVSSPP